MEACCVALRANANPVNVSKGCFINGGCNFWGENVKGGLKSSYMGTHLRKNFRIEKGTKKARHGVVYSVLTPDIQEEALVSTHHRYFFLFGLSISLLPFTVEV